MFQSTVLSRNKLLQYSNKRSIHLLFPSYQTKALMFHSRFSSLFIVSIILFCFFIPQTIFAQSVDLGPLSIGNSKNHNGLRLNFRDKDVESVNGVNLTIWKSKGNNSSTIRGLAIGLPFASAGTLRGAGIGLLAVVAEQDARGFMISGLSNVVGENANTVMASGLLNIVGENSEGLMFGGLMNISGEEHRGMQFSGLGNIVGEDFEGIQGSLVFNIVGENTKGAQASLLMNVNGSNAEGFRASGLMNITGEDSKGADIAALMNITGESSKGLAVAGLMNVSGNHMKGFSAAGLMNVSERISGFSLAAANVGVHLDGIHFGVLNLTDKKMGDLSGLAFAPVNIARYNQTGITVGIVNFAKKLSRNGLQLGLLNVVKSNPRGLKVLPFFNKNFK